MTAPTLRTVSYGGGVQSTALLVLAAQRIIDFPVFLMANVGDDSEDPLTLEYVETYAKPYAARHGIALHVLDRIRRTGEIETLYGRLMKDGSRSLPIPVRMSNGAPGTRSCTADFKIAVVGKWLQAHGAHGGKRCKEHKAADRVQDSSKPKGWRDNDTGPRADCRNCAQPNRATVGIGISLDEIGRVNKRRAMPYEEPVYPLLDHTPALRRSDCHAIITAAGLPVPPKSSCYFCPFHRPATWAEMRRDRPALFAKACHLEDTLNGRRDELGKDHVYLTRFNRPLDMLPQAQEYLPGLDHVDLDDAECDNGVCFV